jgi:hypothetical protein
MVVMQKCAVYELMIADSMSIETNMVDKVTALTRMVKFS